jgi:starch synthase
MKKPAKNILFISSELTPFAKTGGLADVTASLAAELAKKGHDVRVVIPLYDSVKQRALKRKVVLGAMGVEMGTGTEWCSVHDLKISGGARAVFIEYDAYFARSGLYHDDSMNDYQDNPRRFGFLCRAALQYCIDCGFKPDIVHAHDWQAALVPAYIKLWFWNNPVLAGAASVLSIHNIAYQGAYPASHYQYLGLGKESFTEKRFESFGAVNFMKGGIYFTDVVNTVSPTHAKEILKPYGGFGLSPFLSDKGDKFTGILNGVDYSIWSPQTDPHLPEQYTSSSLKGKAICKQKLREEFKLDTEGNVCLIATIGRFVLQKGFHLVREAIGDILDTMVVQFVILGDGDNSMEEYFEKLAQMYPGQAGSFIGYNAELAHRVEAGADFFLMPSLYEPCGLNQMYSLKYGTLPIVHATGGLDDTVEQYNESTGDGTGFKFEDATAGALYDTVGWAVSTYYDRPHHIKKMINRAMNSDFSWSKSVEAYENLYEKAIVVKKGYDRSFL